MYYVAPETPMMSSVIADCPDLAPPQYFGQVYAYFHRPTNFSLHNEKAAYVYGWMNRWIHL